MKSDVLSDISLEESIFRKSSCAILVDIFWHEIRRSNFKWFQIGIDQTMKQVIPEMILIWRVEIYCRLPLYLIQSGFIESIAIKISKFSSKLFFVFRVFLDFGARLGPGRWFRTKDFLVKKTLDIDFSLMKCRFLSTN